MKSILTIGEILVEIIAPIGARDFLTRSPSRVPTRPVRRPSWSTKRRGSASRLPWG